MCALYVEIMCAGRIGLGWAYDVFTFACHIFMHFSCIRTNFFLLIDINCVGIFLRVFLSLSLFLSVSCSMAPKRKSIPSRNPLRSGASFSSPPADSTPFHVRFCDDNACKAFSENFSWCDIHSERQVILLNFFDSNLPTVIYSRGWESLCGILVTCPSIIIQDFYSNMHGFDYSVPHFFTRI